MSLTWFTSVEANARAFRRITNTHPDAKLRHLDAQLYLLTLLPWREWQPIALHILMTSGLNAFNEMRSLQRACWKMLLAGFSASDRAETFHRALDDYDTGVADAVIRHANRSSGDRGGAFRFGLKQVGDIREALLEPVYDVDTRRALALWLEATSWGNYVPSHINREATVEHVLPETPRHRSQWLIDFPDEDMRALRRQQIGNLCIVPQIVNKDRLKNFDFDVKRPILAEQTTFKLAQESASYEHWTGAEILERTKRLRDHALKQLSIRP